MGDKEKEQRLRRARGIIWAFSERSRSSSFIPKTHREADHQANDRYREVPRDKKGAVRTFTQFTRLNATGIFTHFSGSSDATDVFTEEYRGDSSPSHVQTVMKEASLSIGIWVPLGIQALDIGTNKMYPVGRVVRVAKLYVDKMLR